MVLAFFGHDVPEAEIAQLLGTDDTGTKFDDIVSAGSLGFQVTISKGSLADLQIVYSSGIPLIVAVHTLHLPNYPAPGGKHSLVVAGATRGRVCVYDPDRTKAPEFIGATQFERAWKARQSLTASIVPG